MISTWIWHKLPGPVLVKVLILLVLVAAVVYSLFEWVFPWVSEAFQIQEQNVEQE